jgi:serine/threonine-protein phosphatase 6 regulatory ankyrin repeat subunit B
MRFLDRILDPGRRREFCVALETGAFAQVQEMLAKGPQLLSTRCGKYEESALHVASRLGHLEIVRLLLQKGAPIDDKDGLDGTPLHRAAYNGRHDVVALLLERGARVNARGDRFDQTPLFSAAANGHSTIVELLLNKGANPNWQNSGGYTALHVASVRGHLQAVNALLKGGAASKAAKDGVTPLDQALTVGAQDIVVALRNHHARG